MSVRLLVCGGRDYSDRERLFRILDAAMRGLTFEVLIHGGATGADALAADWAKARGVKPLPFPISKADWDRYGKGAGPRRNEKMLREGAPTLVIAFPGKDGTADMVRRAKAAGLRVVEVGPAPPKENDDG
jgi:hypothetical protein